ncbi:MAG: rhombosortase [Desulfobacter sp.]|nr:MAG: rhombosortase [Desulfobacter sp.]
MAEDTETMISRPPLVTLVILLICLAAWGSPQLSRLLIYDRRAIADGEIWRLFTAHFVHFTGSHLAYNMTVFTGAGWLVESKGRCRFIWLYILTAMGVGMQLFVGRPGMGYYGGISGVACGVLFYGALTYMGDAPWRRISICTIFCLLGKVVLELGCNIWVIPHWSRPFVPMSESHGMGVVCAGIFYLFALPGRRPTLTGAP